MKKQKFSNTAYKNKFISEKYDRVNLTLPKGKKEELQKHAEKNKESLNGFINRAINEAIERDGN
ncbi:MAG: Arc family DNA-binding protein [Ruminococcaceae bacterium]|nr:Arc family DNA-binding protein [Oscillospiraceae bacterium]